MTSRRSLWRGVVSRAVLLAIAASIVPQTLMASDTKRTPDPTPIKSSIQAIAAREAAKTDAARPVPVRRAEQNNPSTESRSFFKTAPGIAALAIMAVGTGYALYSAHHDRVHSPAAK